MNDLSKEERLILDKLLSRARESTTQMIDTCENLLNEMTHLDKERIRADQMRFEIDLEHIKSLEEKLGREKL